MQEHHEVLIEKCFKVFTLIIIYVSANVGSFLAGAGSLMVFLYYISKIKFEIVDVKFNGSWKSYFKSLIGL